ncbi:MAG TPA: hypothetical protein DEQ30_12490 [Porphyromonadaceae bacterium]|nr:hypothetical protein [Porphyromonadaceae bacterium]
MKDIHISAGRQKSELKWLAGCFCVAFLLNILSIIIYKTLWSEIFTQFLWVLIITCVLYAVSVFLRFGFYLIKRLF